MTTQITDHVAKALDLLPQQFREKANIEQLLTLTISQIQELEDAFYDLLTLRQIETAADAQLDDIGQLVGQPRDNHADDDYRRIVRARIAANRSHGTMKDLYDVARLILNDSTIIVQFLPQTNATGVMRATAAVITDLTAEHLLEFLQRAASAGVRIIVEWTANIDSELLYLDIDNLDQERFIGAIG